MGSKSRIAKYIVPILQKEIDDNNIQGYYEPFCGSCSIIDKIQCSTKVASDLNQYLIALLKHVASEGGLPQEVPKELYDKARQAYYNNDLTNFEEWEIGAIGFNAPCCHAFLDIKR